MDGTSIQDLQNIQYGAMQNLQYEQGHNAHHTIHQAQHAPYYDIIDNNNYPQMQNCRLNMDQLATDITANLPEEALLNDIEEHLEEEVVTKKENDNGLLSFIPAMLREPLLILAIYVLLSQKFVQQNIGKYIKQINPNQGQIPLVGIVIYGVIFAVFFSVLKQFLL